MRQPQHPSSGSPAITRKFENFNKDGYQEQYQACNKKGI
jgi:hypothetical protein